MHGATGPPSTPCQIEFIPGYIQLTNGEGVPDSICMLTLVITFLRFLLLLDFKLCFVSFTPHEPHTSDWQPHHSLIVASNAVASNPFRSPPNRLFRRTQLSHLRDGFRYRENIDTVAHIASTAKGPQWPALICNFRFHQRR